MKQFSLTTLSLLCAAVSPLCAEGMMRHSRGQQTSSCPTQQFAAYTITPPAGAKPTNHVNPYFTAEFILWKAYEDGLDFAYTGAPTSTAQVNVEKGQVLHPGHKYEPGFKLGFGLKFLRDAWDLYANYTWLQVTDSKDFENEDSDDGAQVHANYFVPTFPNDVKGTIMNETSATWKLNFDVLDLELGRDFFISKYLTLRPHFGFKFSWMKQKFDVDYTNIIAGVNVDALYPAGSNVDIDFKQTEFGVGIRTGIDTAWRLGNHFSIFGDLALTGLWNHFKEKRKDEVETAADVEYDTFNVKDTINEMTAVLELAIGLRFDYAFNCDKNLFIMQAGWEQQIWFDQNQFFRAMSTDSENLTFEGLTAKIGFAF